MKNCTFLLITITLFFSTNLFAQEIIIKGKVTDKTGKTLSSAAVSFADNTKGTFTSETGEYQITTNQKPPFNIIYSLVGYHKKTITITNTSSKEIEQNVILDEDVKNLSDVDVISRKVDDAGIIKINPKSINRIPNITGGGLENLLKTMPGVASNNELSSQYNVRGGNFDENLVYVNDIEVFRPILIRSGQQEGLSFVNSDLVSSIEFSSGGFQAKYDDKMSSVLDIRYKKPKEFAGSVSGSLLSGSAHIEGCGMNNRFTYIGGIRYKTAQYLLQSLDEKGEYNPTFTDAQTFLTYKLTPVVSFSFLGNIAQNKYQFIPQMRETSFGLLQNAMKFSVAYNGQEIDKFTTAFGALTTDFRFSKNLIVKLIASTFRTKEQETFDIEGYYWLNAVDRQMGSDNLGDSLMNLGYGSYLDHARNYLYAQIFNFSQKGYYTFNNNTLLWGIKYQNEKTDDKINEWQLIDSAGYSVNFNQQPNTEQLVLNRWVKASNKLNTNRYSAYIQNSFYFNTDSVDFNITAGFRASYWDQNKQLIISPRVSINFQPNWNKRIAFRFAAGIYYQPPFYREIRDFNGKIALNKSAQQSIHFVAGADYDFIAWGRPFKFITEIYYKKLDNLIPYEIDNVRIRYYANQRAKGYAAGIDLKVNGEFVEGIESWGSLSILKTEENIVADTFGYIPRPTDQRLNIGLFFQDYVPGYEKLKVHLTFHYGSPLPVGPPNTERGLATHRIHPAYLRTDIGASYQILDRNKKTNNNFNFFKDIWLSIEIFNLLDVRNTLSYTWLTVVPNSGTLSDVDNTKYAVPNKLTSRLFNIKLNINF